MEKINDSTSGEIKAIVRNVRDGKMDAVGTVSGKSYDLRADKMAYDGVDYLIKGDTRLQVFKISEHKPKSEKAQPKKAPKEKAEKPAIMPAYITVPCRECGKLFHVSKFTPYLDLCSNCRDEYTAANKPMLGTKVVYCMQCGAQLDVNAYDYNDKLCAACREEEAKKKAAVSA